MGFLGPPHQKNQVMIRSAKVWATPPPSSRKERGAGNGASNQSCVNDEACIIIMVLEGKSEQ